MVSIVVISFQISHIYWISIGYMVDVIIFFSAPIWSTDNYGNGESIQDAKSCLRGTIKSITGSRSLLEKKWNLSSHQNIQIQETITVPALPLHENPPSYSNSKKVFIHYQCYPFTNLNTFGWKKEGDASTSCPINHANFKIAEIFFSSTHVAAILLL